MSTIDSLLSVGPIILMFGGPPMLTMAVVLVFLHRDEKDNTASYLDADRRLGNIAAGACSAVTGVVLWLAWFSWGDPSGYATWAIVAAVISALTFIIGLGLLTRWKRTGPFVVAFGGLFGFSTSFAVDANGYDTTGMWGVGYLILVFCASIALVLIGAGVSIVRTRR